MFLHIFKEKSPKRTGRNWGPNRELLRMNRESGLNRELLENDANAAQRDTHGHVVFTVGALIPNRSQLLMSTVVEIDSRKKYRPVRCKLQLSELLLALVRQRSLRLNGSGIRSE